MDNFTLIHPSFWDCWSQLYVAFRKRQLILEEEEKKKKKRRSLPRSSH